MAITFERDLTGAETAELMLKYPEQTRFLENLPIELGEGDSYNDIMAKCAALDKDCRIRYARELSEEQAIRLVTERPYNFEYIENPTNAVCMAAVENHFQNLGLVPDGMLSEEQLIDIVKDTGEAISEILEPSKAVCMAAAKNNGMALRCINSWDHPSFKTRDDILDVYIEATKQNGIVTASIDYPVRDPGLLSWNELDRNLCVDALEALNYEVSGVDDMDYPFPMRSYPMRPAPKM